MLRRLPPPVGGRRVPTHRVLLCPKTDWLSVHVLGEPRAYLCHWSPQVGRTAPCVTEDCKGCQAAEPWPFKVWVAFPSKSLDLRGMLATVLIPEDTSLWVYDALANRPWRGAKLYIAHQDRSKPSSPVTAKLEGHADPGEGWPAWDVEPDLVRLWREWLPKAWNGQFTLGANRDPGQEG